MISLGKSLTLAAIVVNALVSGVAGADDVECGDGKACPEDKPCCNQYGTCGTGSFCLGGCNPKFSYKKEACMPLPVCRDSETIFDNYTSKMVSQYTYLGDANKANWTYEGYPLDYPDEKAMLLAMPKNSGGSVISSTHYVWYGNVKTRFKTSHGAGVVSAFILLSSVQDEIDYEWVGADLDTAQTNWYWQGALNYTNSRNLTADKTDEEYHIYELDWTEDRIQWKIDGKLGRTLAKNDTYNSTTKRYDYPQTPARVQMSIWPGGNATNAPGTVAWAGGEIDWDSDDIKDNGYYYAVLESVNITCYEPPTGTKKDGSKAYEYTGDDDWLEGSVEITDANTILKDYDNSGLDDNTPDNSSSSESSSTTSKSSSSSKSSESKTTSESKSTSVDSDSDKDAKKESTTSSTLEPASATSSAATGFVQNISSTGDASSSDTSSSAGNAHRDFSFKSSIGLLSGLILAII